MPRRTAEEAAKTRKAIIVAAQALFSAHGFAATRTAEVARAAGTSEGGLFHHFKDKSELFGAVVERLQRAYVATIYMAATQETAALDVFLTGTRKSLELSIESDYLRIVMMEAPVVLGARGWREMDAKVGLMMIEPNLLAVAERESLPEKILKPMALMVMGLVNETIFALARKDAGVSIDGTISLLKAAVLEWASRLEPEALIMPTKDMASRA